MNKIANILITSIFLLSFIGIQVNKHYSHGKLYSVAIFEEAENCCTSEQACEMHKQASQTCEKENSEDCSCEDISNFYHLQDNFVEEEFSIPAAHSFYIFQFADLVFEEAIFFQFASKNFEINISPPKIEQNVQISFGVFRC